MTKDTEHTLERILERITKMYWDQGIVQKVNRFVRVELKSYTGETGEPPEFRQIHFDSYFFYRDIDSGELLRVVDFNAKIKKEVNVLFSIIKENTRKLKLLDSFVDSGRYMTPIEFFEDSSYRLWLIRDQCPIYESKEVRMAEALKGTKDYFYSFLKKTANEQIVIFDED